MINEKTIGERCRAWRIRNRFSQSDIAREVCYAQGNVSKFESGKNDNSKILMWYLVHGMTKKELITGMPCGEDDEE